MTVDFWLSKEYEYPHEHQAVQQFLRLMFKHFGHAKEHYWVLGNLQIPDAPIDLAVIKRNGILIMELKDLDKPVHGGETGTWYINNSDGTHKKLIAGKHDNPFEQVSTYRVALYYFLEQHAREFLSPNREKKLDFRQIHAYVVFTPAKPEGTDIKIPVGRHPRKWWGGVVGMDDLHLEVRKPSVRLKLKDHEIKKLIEGPLALRKQKSDTWVPEHMLPSVDAPSRKLTTIPKLDHVVAVPETAEPTTTEPEEQTPSVTIEPMTAQPEKQTPSVTVEPVATEPEKPPPSVTIEPVAAEPEKQTPSVTIEPVAAEPEKPPPSVTIEPVAAEPVEQSERCFVCKILPEKECEQKIVRGRLMHVHRARQNTDIVIHTVGSKVPTTVQLRDRWADLATDLSRLLRDKRRVHIVAHHLSKDSDQLVAGAQSLIIVQPDWLITVTDLTKVDYCERELPISRYTGVQSNEPIIRGNVVHGMFPTIWSEAAGEPESEGEKGAIRDRETSALKSQVNDMALANVWPAQISKVVEPHVKHLLSWAKSRSHTMEFRDETFVIAPAVGLKGRVDCIWEKDGKPVTIGELKTGKSWGAKPQRGHEIQLVAYAMMLLSNNDEIDLDELYGVLLYSGNKPKKDDHGRNVINVMRRVDLTLDKFQNCVDTRNRLVLVDLTGEAHFETTNPNKCEKCSHNQDCAKVALLGDHNDPREKQAPEWLGEAASQFGSSERAFFKHYEKLLVEELIDVKANYANLWVDTAANREADGKALQVKTGPVPEQDPEGRYLYTYLPRKGTNESELRKGDYVILSGASGPSLGRLTLGTVVQATVGQVVVRTAEKIRFEPRWLDTYSDEHLLVRQFLGLYRWVSSPGRQRDVILDGTQPQFEDNGVPSQSMKKAFGGPEPPNANQRQAIQRCLRAQDYLLVRGPPGSGKTRLIKSIVQTQVQAGKKVLITANTNRAVDEALKKLLGTEIEGHLLRLGHSEELREHTVEALTEDGQTPSDKVRLARERLTSASVVGATTSTLASGKYADILGTFDFGIIDEAAQVTVPSALAALALIKNFVLIGDEKQLPPIVRSERRLRMQKYAGSDPTQTGRWQALSTPLFTLLRDVVEDGSGEGLVALTEQFRMNAPISALASTMFYDGELEPANKKVANARLQVLGYDKGHDLHEVLRPDPAIVFIDVPVGAGDAPRTNLAEAYWIGRIVKAYKEFGLKLPRIDSSDGGNIAVIAPFRAQVAAIRRELEDVLQDYPDDVSALRDLVDTVDRFQGGERDLVIVSLACGSSGIHELLQDGRRLNVAITRARHKLIILGNYDLLSRHPLYHDLFKAMAEICGDANWRVQG